MLVQRDMFWLFNQTESYEHSEICATETRRLIRPASFSVAPVSSVISMPKTFLRQPIMEALWNEDLGTRRASAWKASKGQGV